MPTRYLIRAEWDEDAKVWVATSDDVLGLATEADSIPDLVERLERILPELMVENGQVEQVDGYSEIPFTVMHEHVTRSDV
jgi:predicted RNase H-like HicB family nuclease